MYDNTRRVSSNTMNAAFVLLHQSNNDSNNHPDDQATTFASPRPKLVKKKSVRRLASLDALPLWRDTDSSSNATTSTVATSSSSAASAATRSVRFAANAQGAVQTQVHHAPAHYYGSISEDDTEEHAVVDDNTLWWSRFELQRIRRECQALVKELMAASQDDSNHYVHAIQTLQQPTQEQSITPEQKQAALQTLLRHQALEDDGDSPRGLEASFASAGKERMARHRAATLAASTGADKASSCFCRRGSNGSSHTSSARITSSSTGSNKQHTFSSYLRKQSKHHSKASRSLALTMAQYDAKVAAMQS